MNPDAKTSVAKRLAKIEGQVRVAAGFDGLTYRVRQALAGVHVEQDRAGVAD